MRELDRSSDHLSPTLPRDLTGALPHGAEQPRPLTAIGIVGRGRVGQALGTALDLAGYDVPGPFGRGEVPHGCDAILLCVPDGEIASAAATVAGAAPFVGHTSGATPLTALGPARAEHAFGLHPLQTVTGPATDLRGCGCAIAGTTSEALDAAVRLATDLGMAPFPVQDEQRAAYHAAASIASNFLVTLEAEAEQLAASAGIAGFDARRMLGPLVRTTVENWLERGPRQALTGPVARGDHATVAAQRAAVAQNRPQLEPLFDALVERTEALAGSAR